MTDNQAKTQTTQELKRRHRARVVEAFKLMSESHHPDLETREGCLRAYKNEKRLSVLLNELRESEQFKHDDSLEANLLRVNYP